MKTIAKIQAWASYAKKSLLSLSTGVLAIVAVLAPSYSDETGAAVGFVVALLGLIATYKVTNGPKPKKA